MLRFGKEFIGKLKTNDQPIYRLGLRAGFSPSSIYKILCGIQSISVDDPRLVRLAKLISHEGEIFEKEDGQ